MAALEAGELYELAALEIDVTLELSIEKVGFPAKLRGNIPVLQAIHTEPRVSVNLDCCEVTLASEMGAAEVEVAANNRPVKTYFCAKGSLEELVGEHYGRKGGGTINLCETKI